MINSLSDKIYDKAANNTIPLAVHFDLTYRCNLDCIHCYISEEYRKPTLSDKKELVNENRKELETKEIFNILDQLKDAGTLFLTFSGGEIFLRSDILEILRYARDKRFSFSLLTNGTLLSNDGIVEQLNELDLQAVDVSLYSSQPDIHDSITQSFGSYKRTVTAIERLRERDVTVTIKCPIMKTNVDSYQGIVNFADSHGANFVFDPNITPMKNGDMWPTDLRISDQELKSYFSFIERFFNEKKVDNYADPSAPFCEDSLKKRPCGASHSSCYISPYGDIQACIEIPISCGNLREESFEKIWESSEEMIRIRQLERGDFENCSDCPNSGYCPRCMGQSYVENGSLLSPSPEICRETKIRSQLEEVKKHE